MLDVKDSQVVDEDGGEGKEESTRPSGTPSMAAITDSRSGAIIGPACKCRPYCTEMPSVPNVPFAAVVRRLFVQPITTRERMWWPMPKPSWDPQLDTEPFIGKRPKNVCAQQFGR